MEDPWHGELQRAGLQDTLAARSCRIPTCQQRQRWARDLADLLLAQALQCGLHADPGDLVTQWHFRQVERSTAPAVGVKAHDVRRKRQKTQIELLVGMPSWKRQAVAIEALVRRGITSRSDMTLSERTECSYIQGSPFAGELRELEVGCPAVIERTLILASACLEGPELLWPVQPGRVYPSYRE